MKLLKINLILVIASLFVVLFQIKTAYALTQANYERINLFEVEANINPNGTVDVTEKIHYYFPEEKHGIFRDVPLSKTNQDKKVFLMKATDISVSDEKGKAVTFQDSSTNDEMSLKIGDADKFVSGSKTYVIKYTLSGALTYFSDHDELYWNATGDQWVVPIESFKINVNFPTDTPEFFDGICYTGFEGDTAQNCTVSKPKQNQILITDAKTIFAGEGVTFAVKFPKNIIKVLEAKELKNYDWIYSIIFNVLGMSFYIILPIYLFIKARRKYKKWPEEDRVVTAWFEPPKGPNSRLLTAGETGTVIDGKTDIKDISATLIQLAQKGYIKIIETDQKLKLFSKTPVFKFVKTGKDETELLNFEKKLIDAIFLSKDETTTKALSERIGFSTKMQDVMKNIADQLEQDKLYEENVYTHKQTWIAILMMSLFFFNPLLLAVSAYNYFKVKKSRMGAEAVAVAKSLKNFLVSQDDKLEFQAEKQMMFEKLLPYAISFGVEKIWINRFKDIMLSPPEWYQSTNNNAFNYYLISSSLNNSFVQASQISSSRSSTGHSSGFSGGFSGGGGGGGGGGSW